MLPRFTLLLLLVPACLSGPRPQALWKVREHPLYPPTVWVETDAARGGGVVIHSSPEVGTVILTAFHNVRGQSRIEVGAFRHSLLAPGAVEGEYQRFRADLVAGEYLLDKDLEQAYRALVDSYTTVLDSTGAPADYPLLLAQRDRLRAALTRMRRAASVEDGIDAMESFAAAYRPYAVVPEFERARDRVAKARGTEAAQSLTDGWFAATDALSRALDRAVKYGVHFQDVALLRLRTHARFHAAKCVAEDPPEGADATLVTILPEFEPRARPVRIGGETGLVGRTVLDGAVRHGNSGSPVFVGGRLAGIVTEGTYPTDENEPEDGYRSGRFIPVSVLRHWLARRGLDPLLD
jgi:hypothetical protein